VKGEHFVTTESGVTVIGNSLWAAMGNADGIEAAFWSAICGRTPRWGLHLPERRPATHVVRVEVGLDRPMDWDLLGAAVGSALPGGAVPVLEGGFRGAAFDRLRQLFTSLAITSNCELCHIAGLTPEARDVADALKGRKAAGVLTVGVLDLEAAYAGVCDAGGGPLDLVSLGCPHYGIDQIKTVAARLEGRKVSPHVHFMVWTAYPIKCMADANGYTDAIERAGGHVYSGTCPTTIGPDLLDVHSGMLFDSLKQAMSVRSTSNARIYAGSVEACIEAAVAGRWVEDDRWRRS
jgi:predicted aconitase